MKPASAGGAHTAALAEFQDAFADALLSKEIGSPEIAALAGQPGFRVYRNTVLTGCIDALQANYPAVLQLVGSAWFRATAAHFAREHLPSQASLVEYDAGFAAFLGRFAPATDLPYLTGVARLDRFWTEAHAARDETPLPAAAVAALAPDELRSAVLRPHAAARWAWFENHPVYTIWRRNRCLECDPPTWISAPAAAIDWRAEGALITRAGLVVAAHALGSAGIAFLDACAAGKALGEAALAALAAEPAADLAQLMAQLLSAGAFGALLPAGEVQ